MAPSCPCADLLTLFWLCKGLWRVNDMSGGVSVSCDKLQTEECPVLTVVPESGKFLFFKIWTWYLQVLKTATEEAIECNRCFSGSSQTWIDTLSLDCQFSSHLHCKNRQAPLPYQSRAYTNTVNHLVNAQYLVNTHQRFKTLPRADLNLRTQMCMK